MSADREGFEWAAYSGKLWSWLEIMERFRAASFGVGIGSLVRAMGFVAGMNYAGAANDEDDRELIDGQVKEFRQIIDELPLSLSLKGQFGRIEKALELKRDSAELMVMVREFYNNLLTEMTAPWFLLIKQDRRDFYQQTKPPFGDAVAKQFPEALPDISAASRCLALDEWTACVFHCMRALEHGLRAVAAEVGLAADVMAHENWKNVIDQIERKLREMEALPKTPEKAERVRVLSTFAAEFRYFKDAWRNHVSHSRAVYAEIDGVAVYQHVRSFMVLVASSNS